jgi:hypothetical protein
MLATGAPFAMSASNTTNRSSAVRPWPPSSTGHVMPIHPRSPSSRANSAEAPTIHESSGKSTAAAAFTATSVASAWSVARSSGSLKSMVRGRRYAMLVRVTPGRRVAMVLAGVLVAACSGSSATPNTTEASPLMLDFFAAHARSDR